MVLPMCELSKESDITHRSNPLAEGATDGPSISCVPFKTAGVNDACSDLGDTEYDPEALVCRPEPWIWGKRSPWSPSVCSGDGSCCSALDVTWESQ